MSLGSKYDEINGFYTLLNELINTHEEATTTETKNCKNRILNNVNQLYNDYFDLHKKNYNSANVRNKEKRGRDYKQFEVIDNGDQEPKSSKKEETKIKKPDEIQKPIWIKLSREEFNSLIKDVDDNLNNDEFKTTVDKKAYDEKCKKATPKISEKETIKLYSDLIIPDIAVLEESKGKAKDKRNNILNVLENLKPVFTDLTGQFFIMTMCLNQNQKKALRKEQN